MYLTYIASAWLASFPQPSLGTALAIPLAPPAPAVPLAPSVAPPVPVDPALPAAAPALPVAPPAAPALPVAPPAAPAAPVAPPAPVEPAPPVVPPTPVEPAAPVAPDVPVEPADPVPPPEPVVWVALQEVPPPGLWQSFDAHAPSVRAAPIRIKPRRAKTEVSFMAEISRRKGKVASYITAGASAPCAGPPTIAPPRRRWVGWRSLCPQTTSAASGSNVVR